MTYNLRNGKLMICPLCGNTDFQYKLRAFKMVNSEAPLFSIQGNPNLVDFHLFICNECTHILLFPEDRFLQ